jgi:microcystin degradation protein MlrC
LLPDVGDNVGGGAMSDSTFVLKALLDAGVSDVALHRCTVQELNASSAQRATEKLLYRLKVGMY